MVLMREIFDEVLTVIVGVAVVLISGDTKISFGEYVVSIPFTSRYMTQRSRYPVCRCLHGRNMGSKDHLHSE